MYNNGTGEFPVKLSVENKLVNETYKRTDKSPDSRPLIKILSDSHGRNLRELLEDRLDDKYQVYSSIKPNGRVVDVTNDLENEIKNLDENDFLIIIGGTNDIKHKNDLNHIVEDIQNKLKISTTKQINVILSAIPYRYDLPALNRNIRNVNESLRRMAQNIKNVDFAELTSIRRDHYTNHGLHFNKLGKIKLIHTLINRLETLRNMNSSNLNLPIPVRITTVSYTHLSLKFSALTDYTTGLNIDFISLLLELIAGYVIELGE